MLADDFLDDVEDDRVITVDDLVRGLMGGDVLAFDEDGRDEGTEELDGHFPRESALVHLEVGSDRDDGTSGVVDTLAEEVLTEPALLAL